MMELCSEAALSPTAENSWLSPNGNLRPADVWLPTYQNGKGVAIDVVITHPLQPLYLTKSVERWGVAAEAAEEEKKKKYTEDCRKEGFCFMPFAVESLGGLGKEAISFLNLLCLKLALVEETSADQILWDILEDKQLKDTSPHFCVFRLQCVVGDH